MCIKTEKVLFDIARCPLRPNLIRHVFLEVVCKKKKDSKPVTENTIFLTEGQNLQYQIRSIVMEPNSLVDDRIRL